MGVEREVSRKERSPGTEGGEWDEEPSGLREIGKHCFLVSCGLDLKCPHRLTCLNTWSPGGRLFRRWGLT